VIVIEYILLETMTLLRARGFSVLAVQFREGLSTSQIFTLRYSTPRLEQATFDLFRRYADKKWSYADGALLATANMLNTSLIFSFDHHIDQMALQRVPQLST
jgi:predicted nucleic acid-binding protein